MEIVFEELVRDKIPNILNDNGYISEFRILDDFEYLEQLEKKILEELLAYLEDDDFEKLIDVYDLLIEILNTRGIGYEEFQEARYQKYISKGDYKKRVYLISGKKDTR